MPKHGLKSQIALARQHLPWRHDHRRSLWVIGGGAMLWCYQCGAWRYTGSGEKWHRPTGLGGPNPAVTSD